MNNKEQLYKLSNEINDLVVKLSKIVNSIKALDSSIEDPKQEEFIKYNHTLMLLDDIKEYVEYCKVLDGKLNLYKDTEEELNLPPNFNYRRLLKKIKECY